MRKRFLWRIRGPVEIGNVETTADQFVGKEDYLYLRAYTRNQAVWLFAERFSRMAGLEHHEIYIGDASVFRVEEKSSKEEIKSKFKEKIKRKRGKQKRKKELERMMGKRGKESQNDNSENGKQMKFDF